MSFLTKTDKNLVDESISRTRETVPLQIRSCIDIFLKYSKLAYEIFDDVTKGDTRHTLRGVTNPHNIFYLTFDKMLFALDKDKYIDFTNEISSIKNWNNTSWRLNEKHGNENEYSLNERIELQEIALKYLINPDAGIGAFGLDQWVADSNVPMIKIEPYYPIDLGFNPTTYNKRFETTPTKGNYNFSVNADEPSRDSAINGIGLNYYNIGCGAAIDIPSLFECIYKCASKELKDYGGRANVFRKLASLSPEESAQMGIVIHNILAPRVTYSLINTYLATITKLTKANHDFFGTISGTILNSCRGTLFDNYGYDGEDTELNKGTALRHMALDISDILNALAASDTQKSHIDFDTYEQTEGWRNPIRSFINTLFSLQYQTYNYIEVPADNLKFKSVQNIESLAKLQAHLVSPENAKALREMFDKVNCDENDKYGRNTIKKLYLTPNSYRNNGTYTLIKRLYDCGKDFLDTYAKFVLIKKRMHEVGAMNFTTGDIVDKIGKTYRDYRQNLTNTYVEIKTKLNNLVQRIKAIIKGTSNSIISSTLGNVDSSPFKDINEIVYGLTSESRINVSQLVSWTENDERVLNGIDSADSQIPENKQYINEKTLAQNIADVIEFYKTYSINKECTYLNNYKYMQKMNEVKYGSLVKNWIALNLLLNDLMDIPYKNQKFNMDIIAEEVMNYGVKSISEMTPNPEAYDAKINRAEFVQFKREDTRVGTMLSLEELKDKFEFLKKSVEENEENGDEDLFGLFADFGGIPLAKEITDQESAYDVTEREDPTIIQNDSYTKEKDEFGELKADFDAFMEEKF